MKRTVAVELITLFFVVLFFYTGIEKLLDLHLFREQMMSSPLIGPLSGFLSWSLPIGELLLAITLVIPFLRLRALYITMALMLIFTVYVIIIFFMDNHLSCSCGGIVEELSPQQHIVFNIACVILALIGIIIERRQTPTRRFNWFTGTASVCLLLLIGAIVVAGFSTPATVKTGMEGRLLPSFKMLLPDSSTYLNTESIPSGTSSIFIGFSPWCTHCQAETREIIAHIQLFKNIRIYYVTPFPFGQMKTFYDFFQLKKYPNIVMGRDTADVYMKYFKAKGVPFVGVFDAKKRLVQTFSTVEAAKLAQIINK